MVDEGFLSGLTILVRFGLCLGLDSKKDLIHLMVCVRRTLVEVAGLLLSGCR